MLIINKTKKMNNLVFINTNFFLIPFFLSFMFYYLAVDLKYGTFFIFRFLNTPLFIVNIMFFILFMLIFQILDFNISVNEEVILNIDNNNNIPEVNVGENATVNVNNPRFSASFNSMDRVAAAISATGGASAGLGVAKYIGGTSVQKAAAGIGTMVGIQATTYIMSYFLNSGLSNNNNVNKLIDLMVISNNNTNSVLNNYPLGALSQVNTLLALSILFLYLIGSIYVGRYVVKINYTKYFPNNKIGKVLDFLLSRYIKLWSKSSNYLLLFSYIVLLISIIICKIDLHTIISYYS